MCLLVLSVLFCVSVCRFASRALILNNFLHFSWLLALICSAFSPLSSVCCILLCSTENREEREMNKTFFARGRDDDNGGDGGSVHCRF